MKTFLEKGFGIISKEDFFKGKVTEEHVEMICIFYSSLEEDHDEDHEDVYGDTNLPIFRISVTHKEGLGLGYVGGEDQVDMSFSDILKILNINIPNKGIEYEVVGNTTFPYDDEENDISEAFTFNYDFSRASILIKRDEFNKGLFDIKFQDKNDREYIFKQKLE